MSAAIFSKCLEDLDLLRRQLLLDLHFCLDLVVMLWLQRASYLRSNPNHVQCQRSELTQPWSLPSSSQVLGQTVSKDSPSIQISVTQNTSKDTTFHSQIRCLLFHGVSDPSSGWILLLTPLASAWLQLSLMLSSSLLCLWPAACTLSRHFCLLPHPWLLESLRLWVATLHHL